MKISVGQLNPSGDMSENLATVRSLAEEAKADGAELIVLPEESMFTVRHVQGDLAAAVESTITSVLYGRSSPLDS